MEAFILAFSIFIHIAIYYNLAWNTQNQVMFKLWFLFSFTSPSSLHVLVCD